MTNRIDEPVKVLFHLNGGFTKVIFERTIGVGLADGGITCDIPTEKIPPHLRKIGSRFVLIQASTYEKIEIKSLE